jgi:CBS domain-containing membrane protein
LRSFAPILPGATARDRAFACLGAVVGIGLAGFVAAVIHGDGEALPWIVAPMGASAVLLFAVPASPMSQPWPWDRRWATARSPAGSAWDWRSA